MMLGLAAVALGVGSLFVLWPLIRHREPPHDPAELEPQGDLRRLLSAIEEVELDANSGRLDAEAAGARLAELRRELEARLR